MLGYDNNTAGFRPGAGTLTVMASIYGSVMLRPARVGLLTAAPTLDDLRHAVHAATSAWGGMYFPIVDIQGGGGNKLWFEQLSIDVLCSLVEHDSANELAQQTGFRWAGRPPYGPFDPPQDGLSTRLLESDHLASPQGAGLALADWSAEDPLSTLFTVWFGDFGADEYGQRCRARFAARGRTIVANSEGVLDPDLLRLASPVAATTFQIEYRGDGPGPGLVVVDPASPADLLRFWNIRAAGGNVVPWPVGGEGVVEPAISAWLEVLLETNQVSRFSGADDTAGSAGLYVWPNRTGDHRRRRHSKNFWTVTASKCCPVTTAGAAGAALIRFLPSSAGRSPSMSIRASPRHNCRSPLCRGLPAVHRPPGLGSWRPRYGCRARTAWTRTARWRSRGCDDWRRCWIGMERLMTRSTDRTVREASTACPLLPTT